MADQQQAALAIIDTIDTNAVGRVMDKIKAFQAVVVKAVIPSQDIGIIPGTNKPTLLKPGAEKIVMMMGLSSRFEIMDKVEDYQTGFFAYNIRCILSKQGLDICQGVGNCNSREKKYRDNDPYSITNTILKMAKKRAYVDAALSVASLSDVFTQDLEDMEIQPGGASARDNQGVDLLEQKITFGKNKDRTLGDLLENDRQYLEWLAGSDNQKWAPIAQQVLAAGKAQQAQTEPAPEEQAQENSREIAEELEQDAALTDIPPAVLKMAKAANWTEQDLIDYVVGIYGKPFAKLTAKEKGEVTRYLSENKAS